MKKLATVMFLSSMGTALLVGSPVHIDRGLADVTAHLPATDEDYFEVTDHEIKEAVLDASDWQILTGYAEKEDTKVHAPVNAPMQHVRFTPLLDDGEDIDVKKAVSTIANIGKLAADFVRFVEDRAPVAEAKSYTANALPTGVESVSVVSNLSNLNVKKYEYSATNLLGIPLYTTSFLVAHRHGGTYKDDGAYLANVTIVPVSAWAPFLFNVHVDAGNVHVNNVGTTDSAVAGMSLEVQIIGKGLLSSTVQKVFFEFRGDSEKHRMFL